MIGSAAVSVILLLIFGVHLVWAVKAWRLYSDVRSLRYAVQAVMLFVGSLGLAVGAIALQENDSTAAISLLQLTIGFSRSVLFIGGVYLIISWRRR